MKKKNASFLQKVDFDQYDLYYGQVEYEEVLTVDSIFIPSFR